MRNKTKNVLLTVAFLAFNASFVCATDISFSGGSAPNSCGEVSNQIPAITTTDLDKKAKFLRCVTDIDALRLTLHKAGLCRTEPQPNSQTLDVANKCVFIIDDEDGIEFTVDNTSKISIPESKIDLSGLTEGTYNYAILVVGNSIKTQLTAQFTDTMQGRNGAGKYCYSLEASDPGFGSVSSLSSLAVNCVANEAQMIAAGNLGFNSKQFLAGRNAGSSNFVSGWTANTGDKVYVLADLNTLATVDATSGNSNATKVMGVMPMSPPVILTPTTSSFNAGFQLEGQGQIFFTGETTTPCNPLSTGALACVTSMRNYGVGFRVSVE